MDNSDFNCIEEAQLCSASFSLCIGRSNVDILDKVAIKIEVFTTSLRRDIRHHEVSVLQRPANLEAKPW